MAYNFENALCDTTPVLIKKLLTSKIVIDNDGSVKSVVALLKFSFY